MENNSIRSRSNEYFELKLWLMDGQLYDTTNFGLEAEKTDYKKSEPFPTGPIVTDSPLVAYEKVMAGAGASIVRDSVDSRVINDVKNGTGKIIDDEDEVGSWPVYNTYGV